MTVATLYLIQEVLAVRSIGLDDPAHFIDAAVQSPRGDEFRQLPENNERVLKMLYEECYA